MTDSVGGDREGEEGSVDRVLCRDSGVSDEDQTSCATVNMIKVRKRKVFGKIESF